MALIRLDKGLLGDSAARRRGQSSITFKSNSVVGHIPLLKLFNAITGSNDYFKSNVNRNVLTSVASRIYLETAYARFSFRKNMRSYMSHDNPQNTMVISMLSVLGIQGKFEESISQGIMNTRGISFTPAKQNTLVSNPVDVFILAMVKVSDIGKINLNGEGNHIEFDSNLITLFVSEEKYHKTEFLEEHYNKTVAMHLRTEVSKFSKKHGMKIEVVPDSILKQYYTNPYSIKTNSIFEIMEIDKQVKEKVFSNISENLMQIEE